MARSQIIKDLANGTVDTITALKRTKVLLSELGNDELLKWIDYEIQGYPFDATLPDYRIKSGNLVGSYFRGSMAAHMTLKNVSLPLGKMPDKIKEKLLKVELFDGVDALKRLAETSTDSSNDLAKVVPADFFPAIANYNEDPFMMITSARVVIGSQCIQSVFSVIENKLLDTLLLLEKEFGNLDELDLDISGKSQEELAHITQKIVLLVYNDQSIHIGDNNKIKDSNIAANIENKS